MQLVLDGQLFEAFDVEASSTTRSFVPTLRPINAEGKFDSSVFREFCLGTGFHTGRPLRKPQFCRT